MAGDSEHEDHDCPMIHNPDIRAAWQEALQNIPWAEHQQPELSELVDLYLDAAQETLNLMRQGHGNKDWPAIAGGLAHMRVTTTAMLDQGVGPFIMGQITLYALQRALGTLNVEIVTIPDHLPPEWMDPPE